jgi:glucose-1-phosphate cytidylyltransferase
MKVIILAGGFGTRLSDYTETIPKPMVPIGERPIIWHIMRIFSFYSYNNFGLALGYKAEIFKKYFINYKTINSDFTINLKNGKIDHLKNFAVDWKVSLIDTGLHTLTGGRVKRMKNYIGNETFLLTYGDGLSDINIDDLTKFHKSHGKLVTVTAVHPSARFGELEMEDNKVTSFKEKPQTQKGWINGGYFVIEPEFLDFIEDDNSILEKDPLEMVANEGQLMAYKHYGYWQCMDTKRDKDNLEDLWNSGKAPWIK